MNPNAGVKSKPCSQLDWVGWFAILLAVLFFFGAAVYGYDPNVIFTTLGVWFLMAAFVVVGLTVAVLFGLWFLGRFIR